MTSRFLAVAAAALLTATPTLAADPSSVMAQFVRDSVMVWAANPEIVNAVRARNTETAGLSEAEIIALDTAWREEVGTSPSPTIDSVMTRGASGFLKAQVSGSGGAITEVFVMGARGLNVAASGVTSDYWQGDEAKFQQTFPMGAEAVHVGDVEFDESAQSYLSQVSFTLVDPDTGEPIGAVTVGLNAEQFF